MVVKTKGDRQATSSHICIRKKRKIFENLIFFYPCVTNDPSRKNKRFLLCTTHISSLSVSSSSPKIPPEGTFLGIFGEKNREKRGKNKNRSLKIGGSGKKVDRTDFFSENFTVFCVEMNEISQIPLFFSRYLIFFFLSPKKIYF